ncbi:hypothetical protein SAY87_019995 [Trapa incisa]|uniref:Uncharacterized protein n=1 Tax=Trapa incisa TaxID=236973 RepID=A0AAN7K355_9MYRT|nr:hypothetical protein SAY87_019995 [Trapa incisa]
MRCQRYPTDLSSGAGVCASYLRERLLHHVDEQFGVDERFFAALRFRPSDDLWGLEEAQRPLPPALPRSVSPRFFSTPQIRPTFSVTCSFPTLKKERRKLSLFVNLFRCRSDEIHPKPSSWVCSSDCVISPPRVSGQASSSSYSSPSWLSFISRHRQNKPPRWSTGAHAYRQTHRISDSRMSIDRVAAVEDRLDSGRSSNSWPRE